MRFIHGYARLGDFRTGGSWLAKESWRGASLCERGIFDKTRLLKDTPEKGFAAQIQVTVAVALLVDSAAINNSVAVGVLSMLLTGRVGDKVVDGKVRNRLASIKRGVSKFANRQQEAYSPGSVQQRLESAFFLPPATSYPEILTHVQHAKAGSSAPLGKAMPNSIYSYLVRVRFSYPFHHPVQK